MMKAVPVEKCVALTLWLLAMRADYRTIWCFKSTVCIVTKVVCGAMVDRLLPEYVKMPTGTAVVEGFKSDHGFPAVCWSYRQYTHSYHR